MSQQAWRGKGSATRRPPQQHNGIERTFGASLEASKGICPNGYPDNRFGQEQAQQQRRRQQQQQKEVHNEQDKKDAFRAVGSHTTVGFVMLLPLLMVAPCSAWIGRSRCMDRLDVDTKYRCSRVWSSLSSAASLSSLSRSLGSPWSSLTLLEAASTTSNARSPKREMVRVAKRRRQKTRLETVQGDEGWQGMQLRDSAWLERLEALIRYQDYVCGRQPHRNGTWPFVTPHSAEDSPLYNWIMYQRHCHRRGLLSGERTRLLRKIDFRFRDDVKMLDELWRERYQQLCRYQEDQNASSLSFVMPDYEEHPQLYKWAIRQRYLYSCGNLTEDRTQLLDRLDFPWQPVQHRNDAWNKMYLQLVQFQEQHQTADETMTLLEPSEEQNLSLYRWIKAQRFRYHRKKLSLDRIKKLDRLNFVWSKVEPPARVWKRMYAQFVQYQQQQQQNVTTETAAAEPTPGENTPLYSWVRAQRKLHQQGRLSSSQQKLLNQWNFQWDLTPDWHSRRRWDATYQRWQTYCAEHPDTAWRGPTQRQDAALHAWLRRQRLAHEQGNLSDEQVQLLRQTGLDVLGRPNHDQQWHTMYQALVRFQNQTKTARPTRAQDASLYNWVHHQRRCWKGGTLSPQRWEWLQKLSLRPWEPEE